MLGEGGGGGEDEEGEETKRERKRWREIKLYVPARVFKQTSISDLHLPMMNLVGLWSR